MAAIAAVSAELSRLRQDIAQIEGRLADAHRLVLEARGPGEQGSGIAPRWGRLPKPVRLPLGLPALDGVLGGGLLLAALHEIRTEETRDGAAAMGFTLALLSRLAGQGTGPAVLWISGAETRRELGDLYGPGLLALGLDPGRVIRVAVRTGDEALWAFEAALACRGLAVAVCELDRPALDLTATRRCSLRAREGGVTGLILRLGAPAEATAADTRFRVTASAAGTVDGFSPGVGRMAWRLALEKNRGGRTAPFTVEWNAHDRSFAEAGEARGSQPHAHPEPVAAPPFDRPPVPPRESDREGRPGWRRAS